MNLVTRNTTMPSLLHRLRSDMDHMLERFFDGSSDDFSVGELPDVDLEETEDEIVVRADLPGVASKDLDVSVHKDVLTISGERHSEKDREGRGYLLRERTYGAFRRSIRLPAEIDAEAIEAEHEDGVVTIHMKKSESSRPRRIRIAEKPRS